MNKGYLEEKYLDWPVCLTECLPTSAILQIIFVHYNIILLAQSRYTMLATINALAL